MLNPKFWIGLGLFVVGSFMILGVQPTATGNVIAEELRPIGWSFGLIFFIAGVLLMEFGAKEPTQREIIRTRKFERAIKKAPKDDIEKALSKLGTGLGGEHPLEGFEGRVAIKTTKGGRIIAERWRDREKVYYRPVNYLPSHKSREYRYR